ncbi:MAG TPA: DNA-binding protein [Candidatus Accumulibacter sp.]|nr:DNA-binding protein [Accumulibacter sp.]
MRTQKLRTPQEVRAEWLRKGMGQNNWARKHGFNPVTVSQVLNGINKGSRGEGHKVAVLLGIKDGEIVDGNGDA